MQTNNYTGMAVYAVLAIAAFIVGIITDNKFVLVAGYIFIVMAQIAYLTTYTKALKKEVDSIKELLLKN